MRVSGAITTGTAPAQYGARVEAFVGPTRCGRTTATGLLSSIRYVMTVNSADQQTGCGTPGATVTFTVNGQTATPTTSFVSGGDVVVDLSTGANAPSPTPTISPTPSGTPTPTPDGGLSPMRVSGRVTVDGAPARTGTIVEAFVGATRCGQATVTNFLLYSSYSLSVNSMTQQPGCGTADATVVYRVNGETASPSSSFMSGGSLNLDLRASSSGASPSPAPTSTPNPTPTPSAAPSPTPSSCTGAGCMLSPTPGSTLPIIGLVQFRWTTDPAATEFILQIGSVEGGVDHFYWRGAENSVWVRGLPSDGSTLYVRLYTKPNPSSDWIYRDYTYRASGGR